MFNINEFSRGDMFRGVCTASFGSVIEIEAVGGNRFVKFLCIAHIPVGAEGWFSYRNYYMSAEGIKVFVSLDALDEDIA